MKKTKNKRQERARKLAAEQRKLYRFATIKMWISFLMSKFFLDQGKIPKNIGNNILMSNNITMTRNWITRYIVIFEMSEYTPFMWTSDLLETVKDQVNNVVIDFTIKMHKYYITANDAGMDARVRGWHYTMDDESAPKWLVRRAARCLYTYDVLKANNKLYHGYTYIAVRSNDANDLRRGMQATIAYLEKIGAEYAEVSMDVDNVVQFTSLLSDQAAGDIRKLSPVIYTTNTLAQSLPGIQGMNNTRGVLFGYDIITNYAYLIDFKATSNAKNIMIEAGSGFGKTYMAQFWLYPFYADGFNLCIMDIKGTEFEALTKALHGHTISMRNDTPYYINTFVWTESEAEVYGTDPKTYANHQLRLCKEKMLIMANLEGDEYNQCEVLIEDFLHFLYMCIGASEANPNTWFRTYKLNPYVVFDYFSKFLSHEMMNKYPVVGKKTLDRLRMFMSTGGSNSHIFQEPLQYQSLLQNRVLRFDFGILEESADQDTVIFRLHVLDMTIINDSFVSYKKKQKQWTVKVLEESQIVDDYLTKIYTREITLRRAQNQVTVLLGNSIAALAHNPLSRPIIENINILVLGTLAKSSRDFLYQEYGLSDQNFSLLSDVQTNSELDHTFLMVNRMEKDATTALLRAAVPKDVTNSSLFKVVDNEERNE